MRANLQKRLEKLEARIVSETLPFFRYGWVKRLPKEYLGERHIVIVKREPTGSPNMEWCEFEERAGPPATDSQGDDCTVYLMKRD
jgi:hypothetical protein